MLGKLGSNSANNAVIAGPAATPVSANGRYHAASLNSANDQAAAWTPWVLIGFLVLWVAWAVVERHQKIRAQVQPKNIAINLRNLVAIVVPVILGLALLRVGLVKSKLLIGYLPSVVQGPINSFLGAMIRLVG